MRIRQPVAVKNIWKWVGLGWGRAQLNESIISGEQNGCNVRSHQTCQQRCGSHVGVGPLKPCNLHQLTVELIYQLDISRILEVDASKLQSVEV